jgi:hypothetical protein
VSDLSVHLAPNAPWLVLLALTIAALALGRWAYRFTIPPLPNLARRALPALRMLALVALLWLLAQPVLERPQLGGARLIVLLDRSQSMALPATPGGPSRARVAEDAVAELKSAWRGRASVETISFAARLDVDSAGTAERSATALGDALAALGRTPSGQNASGVVVVSDGAVNAGQDPAAAARALGIPVHAVLAGEARGVDRSVLNIESSSDARVGRVTPVRVHFTTTDARGTPIGVSLLEDGRELQRVTVAAPGGGAEATAEFRVTPFKAGLAVWTARVDTLPGELSSVNNARQVAVEVAPGRLGVLVITPGLNWDIGFIRRALAGDSSLDVTTWARERSGYRRLERPLGSLDPGELKGRSVVVLDGIPPHELPAGLDAALSGFLHAGGGVLVLGGSAPGLGRLRGGALGNDLAVSMRGAPVAGAGTPETATDARELLSWDDDPSRGDLAWRAAAPLADVMPVVAGGGDRVLIGSAAGGPPLLLARHVGRGQALLVNGTGVWRWSLSGHDELTQERGRRLWRGLIHWLAEPVQGEPLRVRPERWLASGGEPVRLFATLQDAQFRPVAGADVDGEVVDARGRGHRVTFEPRAAGSYVATLEGLAPGRYRVNARAQRPGDAPSRAAAEFAVDRWSLEEAMTVPDSAGLANVAQASGGGVTVAAHAGRWARSLEPRALARGRTDSLRLWESPWIFGVVIGALSLEWAWRRRRGLP